jgi:signal transduction histidine kinase
MNQPPDAIDEELRILILEDRIADSDLCQRELRRAGLRFTARRVQTRAEFEAALAKFRPGLIISDFTLPGTFDGLTALELARTSFPHVPFVLVSGTIGEENAVQAIKLGAADCVLKDRMERLAPAVLQALEAARLRKEKGLAETAPRGNETQRLLDLNRRLVTLQECERRSLARELHDRIGQNLTVLGTNLARLRGGQCAPGEIESLVANCQSVVAVTGTLISDLTTALEPPLQADRGLLEALRHHAGELAQRSGITVEVTGTAPGRRPPSEIETALFRIAQAALNNVAQHAGARNAAVRLEIGADVLLLEVADDGRGFDATAPSDLRRWGLVTMRERAEAIGGSLRIDSAPGRGTRVIVEAPVEP